MDREETKSAAKDVRVGKHFAGLQPCRATKVRGCLVDAVEQEQRQRMLRSCLHTWAPESSGHVSQAREQGCRGSTHGPSSQPYGDSQQQRSSFKEESRRPQGELSLLQCLAKGCQLLLCSSTGLCSPHKCRGAQLKNWDLSCRGYPSAPGLLALRLRKSSRGQRSSLWKPSQTSLQQKSISKLSQIHGDTGQEGMEGSAPPCLSLPPAESGCTMLVTPALRRASLLALP